MIAKTTIAQLRDNLAEYVGEVYYNKKTIIIYKYGEPWARLVPTDKTLLKREKNPNRFFGFLKDGEKGIDFEDRVRRNKAEKRRIIRLRSR